MGSEGIIDQGALPLNTAVGVGSNFLGTNIAPKYNTSVLRVTVSFATSAKLLKVETDGVTTITTQLNSGAALLPNVEHQILITTRTVIGGFTMGYNFRHDGVAPVTVETFKVEEVVGGVI